MWRTSRAEFWNDREYASFDFRDAPNPILSVVTIVED